MSLDSIVDSFISGYLEGNDLTVRLLKAIMENQSLPPIAHEELKKNPSARRLVKSLREVIAICSDGKGKEWFAREIIKLMEYLRKVVLSWFPDLEVMKVGEIEKPSNGVKK